MNVLSKGSLYTLHVNVYFTLKMKFRHKGLEAYWENGSRAGIDPQLGRRIGMRLVPLSGATEPKDMNIPGFDFHELKGDRAGTYAVHVNGPWCITFRWADGEAVDVDFENYH
jgi:toxin HigB-1